jgi:uncharacterized protein involved in exopolysaccharide biosynthesis
MINKQNDITSNESVNIDDIIQKFIELIFEIRKKSKTLLISSIFGLLFGLGYTYIEKPEYKAVLKFALEEDRGGPSLGGGAAGLASQLGLDLGSNGGLFSGANIIELMKSRFIVEKTLLTKTNFNGITISYADYYLNTNNLKSTYNEKKQNLFSIGNRRELFTRNQNLKLLEIYNNLIKYSINISQKDKKVSIVSLEITTNDELFSKLFCEELAKQTSNYYITIKSGKARLNVEILQDQLDSVRKQLDNSILGVVSSTDKVFNLNPSLIKKSTPTRRSQIDVQANTAVLGQLVANLEISKLTLQKETPLIQVLDRPLLPLEIIKTNLILFLIFSIIFFPLFTFIILSIFSIISKSLLKYKQK